MATLSQKINPAAVEVEAAGNRFRHLVVSLRDNQTIAAVREDPALWGAVQAGRDRTKHAHRGDHVTIVSSDGLSIAERCVVTRALGGSVWLSKPLRLVQLEVEPLYAAGNLEVVPSGAGYSLRRTRDNVVEGRIFLSADAAKSEILRRQPSKVA